LARVRNRPKTRDRRGSDACPPVKADLPHTFWGKVLSATLATAARK